jgi:formyltetrahydrofolate deformylase
VTAPRATDQDFVLTVSCPNSPGLVLAVASYLAEFGANISESKQFDDPLTEQFLLRTQFTARDADAEQLRAAFAPVAERWSMTWQIHEASRPIRTLLMVSRFGHCLNDLLYRMRIGGLNVEVPAVVSNHLDFEPLVRSHGIDFHHIPVTADTKAAAEGKLLGLIADLDVELVVLARYMQVLSDDLCAKLAGRAINIHHSFLPSFKGAKPYHQAHGRGVKFVGATAHYVTADLDEGPIIEQDVIRVRHDATPQDMIDAGRDVEVQVLARALAWHTERRVLVHGQRTVVFN